MKKLYGFKVIRSKHSQINTIWSSTDKEKREEHKRWILDNVSDRNYDGITTFDDVESDVVIDSTGYYKDNKGRIVYIAKVTDRDCFGYIQEKTKTGRIKRSKVAVDKLF